MDAVLARISFFIVVTNPPSSGVGKAAKSSFVESVSLFMLINDQSASSFTTNKNSAGEEFSLTLNSKLPIKAADELVTAVNEFIGRISAPQMNITATWTYGYETE